MRDSPAGESPADPPDAPHWTPTSIFRVTLGADYTLNDAAQCLEKVAALGITAVRVSPILSTGPASEPSSGASSNPHEIDPRLGGKDGLITLANTAHSLGMGVIVDIVPGALNIAQPSANPYWHDVMTHGQDSAYASWFDVDWPTPSSTPSTPIYRRVGADPHLVSVRVHNPEVFAHTHQEIATWFAQGLVDGLSVRHIDSIADPKAYLDQLKELTGGFIITEKRFVLSADGQRETTPESWPCSAATGYPLIAAINGLLTHRHGFYHLEALRQYMAANVENNAADFASPNPRELAQTAKFLRLHPTAVNGLLTQEETASKLEITSDVMRTEMLYLARKTKAAWGHLDEKTRALIGSDPAGDVSVENLAEVFGVLTASIPVARADTGMDRAAPHAREGFLAALADSSTDDFLGRNTTGEVPFAASGSMMVPRALSRVRSTARVAVASDRLMAYLGVLLTTPHHPVGVLFSQTTSDVLNVGVTETAHYRYCALAALNEVGGMPSEPGGLAHLLDELGRQAGSAAQPVVNALTSPVTKYTRAERCRMVALSEVPLQLADFIATMRQLQPLDYSDVPPDIQVDDDNYLGQNPAIATNPTNISFDLLFWQSVVGVFSQGATREQMTERALKAARRWTRSTPPGGISPVLERSLRAAVGAVYSDTPTARHVQRMVALVDDAGQRNAVVARAVQLLAPGIPEFFAPLGQARWFTTPQDSEPGNQLLAAGLALRTRHPEVFDYHTAPSHVVFTGDQVDHGFGFAYFGAHALPQVVLVAERLAITRKRLGGWGTTRFHIPTATEPTQRAQGTGAEVPAGQRSHAGHQQATGVHATESHTEPESATQTLALPIISEACGEAVLPSVEPSWRNIVSGETITGLDFQIDEVLGEHPVAILERI